jgi:hypothetical protein
MKFRAYNIDYHEEATLDYWEKHQKNRKPVLCMSTTYERPMKRKSNDDQDDKVRLFAVLINLTGNAMT